MSHRCADILNKYPNVQLVLEEEKPIILTEEEMTALIEYNKLQGRILPTQLVGNTGQQVQINIVGMGVDSPDVVEDETVEGEIVK